MCNYFVYIAGFSKEGKHQNPQIVLGFLVSKDAYPLAYDIFEGNKFERHTMLPVIDSFKKKYGLDQLVIIADSGLLSSKNIEDLQNKGYEFILGARIKNEKSFIKEKILALKLKKGESAVVEKGNLRLIISYSDSRAKKDKYNREKGLERQLILKKSDLSPEKVIEILQSIYEITAFSPEKRLCKKILLLTEEHAKIKKLFNI